MASISKESFEQLEKLASISRAKTFLGREFLTWLWYTAEANDDYIRVTAPASGTEYQVDLWLDDRVVLESNMAKAHVHTLRGGDPSASAEASAALKTGKSVKEMKLGVNINGVGEFGCVLGSQDLSPRSLKLPEPETEDGDASQVPIAARIELTAMFLDVLDGLFSRFMDERIDDAWATTGLEQIRSWIKERQATGDTILH